MTLFIGPVIRVHTKAQWNMFWTGPDTNKIHPSAHPFIHPSVFWSHFIRLGKSGWWNLFQLFSTKMGCTLVSWPICHWATQPRTLIVTPRDNIELSIILQSISWTVWIIYLFNLDAYMARTPQRKVPGSSQQQDLPITTYPALYNAKLTFLSF